MTWNPLKKPALCQKPALSQELINQASKQAIKQTNNYSNKQINEPPINYSSHQLNKQLMNQLIDLLKFKTMDMFY